MKSNELRALLVPLSLMFTAAVQGCGKSKEAPPIQESAAKNDSDSIRAKNASIQFVKLEQKELLTRIDAAQTGVSKLGNKTRKKLKPTLNALDLKRTALASEIDSLPSLNGSDFQTRLARINATLDSAKMDLDEIKKHLK